MDTGNRLATLYRQYGMDYDDAMYVIRWERLIATIRERDKHKYPAMPPPKPTDCIPHFDSDWPEIKQAIHDKTLRVQNLLRCPSDIMENLCLVGNNGKRIRNRKKFKSSLHCKSMRIIRNVARYDEEEVILSKMAAARESRGGVIYNRTIPGNPKPVAPSPGIAQTIHLNDAYYGPKLRADNKRKEFAKYH